MFQKLKWVSRGKNTLCSRLYFLHFFMFYNPDYNQDYNGPEYNQDYDGQDYNPDLIII